MAKELTDRQKNFIKDKIKKEVEEGTFKGNPKHYKKLLIHIETRDIEGWNVWQERSHKKKESEEANLNFAHWDEAQLYHTDLRGAILEKAYLKEASLIGAHLEEANLHESNLEGANLHEAHLEGADIHHAELNNANLRIIWFNKKTKCDNTLFGDTVLSTHPECKISENELIKILSKAEVNNVRFIDPVFGRKVRDENWLYHYKRQCSWYKKPLQFIWCATSNYGRNIWLWALWSLVFAVLFALIYLGFYQKFPLNFHTVYISPDYPFLSFLYYSFVTFTTLGFGDIVPATGWLQFWVALEVVIGYIMLGGLISIFANKLARRS